jgi:hypothetical protein
MWNLRTESTVGVEGSNITVNGKEKVLVKLLLIDSFILKSIDINLSMLTN